MSKAKPKKCVKPGEKLKIKESDGEKPKEDKPVDEAQKSQPLEEHWSDWIWDEEMKLYYRAKPGNGDEWIYDLHPATRKETAKLVPEKFEFPKGEEKVEFVEPKYKFEISTSKGNEYGVSVREEVRGVPAAGIADRRPAHENAAPNPESPARVEGEVRAGGGEEGKRKNVGVESVYEWRDQINNLFQLEKSVDDDRGRGGVRKQQKEGKGRRKDRDKHHERKESKHKNNK